MTGESNETEPAADPEETESPADPDRNTKKTADDTPVAGPAPPERWEEVGRRALGLLVDERKAELDRTVADLHATLDYGTPVDPTHLRNLRDAIAGLEGVVEYDLADLVADATAFEHAAERLPFGSIAAALDTDPDTLNRIVAAGESDDEVPDPTGRLEGGSGE